MGSINDVARAAGVSPSTVSYVLSGRRSISASTRERVLAAVRELGYRPHAAAGALAAGRAGTIGLVAPRCDDLTGLIIHRFVTTILDVARLHSYDLMLVDPAEGVGGLRRVVESRLVDGVILMDVDAADVRVGLLEGAGVPSVVLGTPGETTLPCVDLDFAGAARLAVRHLARQGRTHLALLSPPELIGPPGKSYARSARDGFASAVGGDHTVRVCEATWPGVGAWLEAVSRELHGLDGIVVQHEAALPLLVSLLRRHGRDEVAVVPICPVEIARQLDVPIDHVEIPIDDMARTAAEALFEEMRAAPAPSRLFAPQLVAAA